MEHLTTGAPSWLQEKLRRWRDARDTDQPTALCPECDDTGWIQIEGNRVRRCDSCLSRQRGQAPGVPPEEHGSRIATFTETPFNKTALAHAKHFLAGTHPDLYLWGGVGTGKTRLACAIINELHAAFKQVAFVRVSKLLSTMSPEHMDQAIEDLGRIPFVVLDDVGANQGSDWAKRMLLVLYETRIDHDGRTVWTSNLDLQDLSEFAGDRLTSRIIARAKVVELGGKDWRLKKAAAMRRERG